MTSGGFDESAFANSQLFDELYEKYKQDKNSVDASWRKIFDEFETQDQLGILLSPKLDAPGFIAPRTEPARSKVVSKEEQSDLKIFTLIDAYRSYGHLMAKVNPISTHEAAVPYQLRLDNLGFSKEDLSKQYPTCGLMKEKTASLLQIINTLKEIYCDKIGVEYMGVESPELEEWLQQQIEPNRFRVQLSIEQKQNILQHLNKSELFESFLHTKYVGQKRFSLEGGETLIPIISAIIETGSGLGMDEFVIGMAHRGRLNVLSNILNKSYVDVFSEFDEGYIPDSFEGSGDVKYHKGFLSEISTASRKKVSVSLAPNPSHLEAVNSVVEGQTKARQILTNDEAQSKVIPILVHGDAALAGQGSVYEALQLFKLKGYSTGGTIHIVINNQIGFTTLPQDARSTYYCTDIAKAFGAPVFHVNAEDPEGCVYVTNLAVQLRQKFHCDVFIDMNCYRKYGHNETDEPAFTQPIEYQLIRGKKPIREIYRDELIHQGVLEKFMAEALEGEFKKALQQALRVTKLPPQEAPPKEPSILNVAPPPEDIFKKVNTSVPANEIREIAKKMFMIPSGFNLHPKLQNLIKDRLSMVEGDAPEKMIDWGMGELLAYGTLLWKGTSVRLSGQDVARGTFSHRHAMWMDQVAERSYFPLSHLKPGQGRCDIVNSPLSEMAVLGFEYGYSISNPEALVLWEAQFGDFSNGAQVIIDQFISTAEQKWGRKSSLTLLLPHGYEGQGPEHSSARIERFLQLCGHDNMFVVYPTTPAQLFHLLRRQVLQTLRKPLIVFTPKGLLRHPDCVSSLEELTKGSFQEILDDPHPPKKAKKVYICSGRIYYDIAGEKNKSKIEDMAIIRIEQLYPLNTERLKEVLGQYSTADEYVWVQDEPANMGAWDYIRPLLKEILPKDKHNVRYIGRERSAATAVGSYAIHKKQHAAIMQAIFQNHKPSIFEIARNFKA